MDKTSKLCGNPREETLGERRSAAAATTQIALLDEVFSLRGEELDRLLEALARLGLPDADAVAEQVAALRLAGGVIRLLPTEAELGAVESAVALAEEARPVGPALLRLASACAGADSLDEGGPG